MTSFSDEARKRWLRFGIIASWALSLLCLYMALYGVCLPLAERIQVQRPVYGLFAPAEWIRSHNDWVWNFTEDIYRRWRGAEIYGNRYLFHGKRRVLSYHNNGAKFHERVCVDGVFAFEMWWDKSGRILAHAAWRNGKRWDGKFLDFDGGGLAAYRFWIQQYNNGVRGDVISVDGSLIDIGRDVTTTETRMWRLIYARHTAAFIVAIVWPSCMLLRQFIKKGVRRKRDPSLSGSVPQHSD